MKPKPTDPQPDCDPASPPEDEVRQGIELLFYAYRDFTADPDAILARLGLGRAHHRVIYFVGRYPRITVGELLGILRITKQSPGRVLGLLVRQGYVAQRPGPTDRRERRLELTAQGAALERQLTGTQRARVSAAYRAAGASSVDGFRRVLLNLINEADREKPLDPAPSPSRRT